jgi:hypothetical protein
MVDCENVVEAEIYQSSILDIFSKTLVKPCLVKSLFITCLSGP